MLLKTRTRGACWVRQTDSRLEEVGVVEVVEQEVGEHSAAADEERGGGEAPGAPALNADRWAFGGQCAELLDDVTSGATANLMQSLTQLALEQIR